MGSLNPDKNMLFEQNPHLRMNNEGFQRYQLNDICRFLKDDVPRRKYFKLPHEQRSVNHWGQRKLLLSEIEFLSEFSRPGYLIVYAGAAPGRHIPYLSRLFPDVKFALYDPLDFKIENTDKIELNQTFFKNETATILRKQGEPMLFISDIRTADPKIMSLEEVESNILQDMLRQMEWTIELNAVASMLKFRLPWNEGHTLYLKGKILLPVWGPQTTTECRLVVTDIRDRHLYDNLQYGEQMFYFNTVTRVQYYEHNVKLAGLDHCYDCAAEIFILRNYLRKFHESEISEGHLDQKIAEMADDISRQISSRSKRELSIQLDTETRMSWFTGKRFDTLNEKVIDVSPLYPKKKERWSFLEEF